MMAGCTECQTDSDGNVTHLLVETDCSCGTWFHIGFAEEA